MSNTVDELAAKLEAAGLFSEEPEPQADGGDDGVPPEIPVAQDTPDEEPEERMYAGKYRNVNELENAYQNLESRFGAQGSEVGELRERLARVEGQQYSQQVQQQFPADQVLQAAEENPHQTAVWTLQNAPHLYDHVMEVWYQTQPKDASRFEQQLMAHQVREQIRREFEPMVAPAHNLSEQQSFYQAWGELRAELPEVDQFSQQILEAAEASPWLHDKLQNGDVATKKEVIKGLFYMSRGRHADTLSAAQAQNRAQQAQMNQQAKNQAAGVTGTGSGSGFVGRPGEGERTTRFRQLFAEAAGLPQDYRS